MCLASAGYLTGVILSDPKTSGISLVLLALSYPVYRLTASLSQMKQRNEN
jgi:hypothetical protein